MSNHVRAGMVFGQLTVIEIIPSKILGKPKARCLCSCGGEHITATVQLIGQRAYRCRSCALRLPPGEAAFRKKFDGYKGNARHRNRAFELTIEQFRQLHDSACTYCGAAPARGVDRKDNAQDYVMENCVPCCKQCNYAKRDMTESEFLGWVARIAARQGFSL